MDKTTLLQKQVRDNSEDLRAYLQDLTLWEEDMKRKESEISSNNSETQVPVVRNKMKKTEEKKNDASNEKGKSTKRINSSDYAVWDKFDVDVECEKVDLGKKDAKEIKDEEPSEEYRKSLRDEAIQEKERGNQFVKNKKWIEAISCYTHAIACDPKDPIFFANRALCFLKRNDLYSAEADCSSALQLDPTYVKALQRRAAARDGLKHLQDAIIDLKRVLELEPHNTESKKELLKLEKLIGVNKQEIVVKTDNAHSCQIASTSKDTNIALISTKSVPNQKSSSLVDVHNPWPDRGIFEEIISIEKKPHQRSKEPLRRIEIIECNNSELSINKGQKKIEKSQEISKKNEFNVDYKDCDALAKIIAQTSQLDVDEVLKDIDSKVESTSEKESSEIFNKKPCEIMDSGTVNDDLANILTQASKFDVDDMLNNIESNPILMENKNFSRSKNKSKKSSSDKIKTKVSFSQKETNIGNVAGTVLEQSSRHNDETAQHCGFPVPKTAHTFYTNWYELKNNNEQRFLYLKQIPPCELPEIFQHALECEVFTNIISILSDWFIKKELRVFEYMKYLCDVKRFSTLIMFTTKENKIALNKIFEYISVANETDAEDIEALKRKYEL